MSDLYNCKVKVNPVDLDVPEVELIGTELIGMGHSKKQHVVMTCSHCRILCKFPRWYMCVHLQILYALGGEDWSTPQLLAQLR